MVESLPFSKQRNHIQFFIKPIATAPYDQNKSLANIMQYHQ